MKVFEKCLYDQIYAYTDSIPSKAQCGFGKVYRTQYSIFAMIEEWRCNLDQGGICRALFTDLRKAFDCLVHDFLLTKPEAHGYTYGSLKRIDSYVTERKNRRKRNSLYTSFLDKLIGIPYGSILGPLLSLSGEYHMYQYTHVITSIKIRLKQTLRLTKAVTEMKPDTEQTMKLE